MTTLSLLNDYKDRQVFESKLNSMNHPYSIMKSGEVVGMNYVLDQALKLTFMSRWSKATPNLKSKIAEELMKNRPIDPSDIKDKGIELAIKTTIRIMMIPMMEPN